METNQQKTKLFIDFDNTIVDTTKAFCDYFNDVYLEDPSLEGIKSHWIKEYDLSDVVALSEDELVKGFSSERLFHYLRPYPYVRYALTTLKASGNFQIYLVSNCSAQSATRKIKWLDDFDFRHLFTGTIFLDINEAYNKSLIDMSDSILIDDHKINHEKSNARWKFCYTDAIRRNWHPETGGEVFLFDSWSSDEVLNKLLEIGAKNK